MKLLPNHLGRGLTVFLLLLTACAPMVPSGSVPFPGSGGVPLKPAEAGIPSPESLPSGAAAPITNHQKLAQDIAVLEQRKSDFNQRLSGLAPTEPSAESAPPDSSSSKNTLTGRQQVAFHFDSADLLEVVRVFMGELLKQDYLVYPGVEGQVTMEIDDQLNQDQIQRLLEGVLQINKMTMYYRDGRWHILPLVDAPAGLAGDNLLLPQQDAITRGQQIRTYRLEYVAVTELVKILTPYLSKGAQLYADEASGVLLVCDYPHVLEKVEKLVALFDVGPFAGMNMKVYWPQYVLSEELIKELDALAKSLSLAAGNPNSRLSFLALPRLNLLLAMTRNPEHLAFVDMWIEELDRETPQALKQNQEDGIFFYPVQNGSAEEITTVLDGLFGGAVAAAKKAAEKSEKQPVGTQLNRMFSNPEKSPVKPEGLPDAVSGSLSGPVTFVVDPVSNAVLTRSSAVDYHKILPVIKKLDAYPKQALIEVTIAEIQLDESTKLGVEWQYLIGGTVANPNGTITIDSGLGTFSTNGETLIGSGLTYLLTNTERFTAALKAFSNQNRVNILSSPHILASDNQEAKIDIGDEVPIVTSELRTTEATSTATTVDKSIQYRDVGILLSVTPHIHENGMVSMDVSQEISEISTKTVGGTDSPVFSKRSATTSLSVRDGQTIVIAGLMQQTSSKGYSGVPILGKLPLLRYLFGYEGRQYRNTELMIFITPRVILTEQDSEFVSSSFLQRLNVVRSAMKF